MGAWGHRPFDNDDAADWVWELESAEDDRVLEATLRVVAHASADAYVESDEAARAVAAAELVAAALDGDRGELIAGGPYAEGALAWTEKNGGRVRGELVPLALRARDESEARDLWDEAGADEWLAGLAALERRLESLARA